MSDANFSERKSDHITHAFNSQVLHSDSRFNYEPVFNASPQLTVIPSVEFANKKMQFPIWISSMTGGAEKAAFINKNLAIAASELGLGMGLGSCRPMLVDTNSIKDFNIRHLMPNQPLFANLGIAQLEQLIAENKVDKINWILETLQADGIIIHINPLQEWAQPEGDKLQFAPIATLTQFLEKAKFPIIVKEVGQGFGPKSLSALLELPLEALDLGALGGTNFTKLELDRNKSESFKSNFKMTATLGHNAEEMINNINGLLQNKKNILTKKIIISGGIQNFLDGFYLMQQLQMPSCYAQASAFLKPALISADAVIEYALQQIEGLRMAYTFLEIKK